MAVQKGQWFRTVVDVSAACVIRLKSPLSRERRIVLSRGELFVVTSVPPRLIPPWAHCRPYRYGELEGIFVDPRMVRDPEYRGYSLTIDFTTIERDCEPSPVTDDRPS